ncbi:MAG: helix-hairpin-helix domain-containing protein [Candidatus Helarchaeota archaeon]
MNSDLERLDGIGPATAQKLIDNGFRTIESIAAASLTELTAIDGITESVARKIIKSAAEQSDGVLSLKFKTGEELLEEYKKRAYLTTGCKTFDTILGGGLFTQKLYEFWGSEGTGKSNMLHQLICTAALPESKGGLGAGTIYIDPENSLSLKRIREIAPRFGLDPEAVIKGISRTVPPNSDALKYICSRVLATQIEMTGARLIILDSIATHFRSEYGAQRQLIPERQQKANQILHELKRCAKLYNAVAVITNQATGDPSGYGSGIKHSMGNVIGHESEVRIQVSIKSSSKGERKFKIEKAVDLPRDEVVLKLTETGYYDLGETPVKLKEIISQNAPISAQKTATAAPNSETPRKTATTATSTKKIVRRKRT